MAGALAEALEIAGVQRARLESGDVDGYIASLEAYGRVCRLAVDNADERDRPEFEQLMLLDRQIAELLRAAKISAGRKLSALSAGKTANAAYLAHISGAARRPLVEG